LHCHVTDKDFTFSGLEGETLVNAEELHVPAGIGVLQGPNGEVEDIGLFCSVILFLF